MRLSGALPDQGLETNVKAPEGDFLTNSLKVLELL